MKKLLFFLSCGWIFLTLSGCSSTTEAETETDSDKIEATSTKYEHKKIFFIDILCLEPPYH